MKRHIFSYTAKELEPYIDWSYLLHAWGMNSKSEAARELIEEVREMLEECGETECIHALFALCSARQQNDDIIIEETTTLPLLRQQHAIPGKPNLCLSDFVSPYGDKIGLFATTVEHSFGERYNNDTYRSLLAQTLASRLAEAAATLLHLKVRTGTEIWGYSPDEHLTPDELKAEKNQGIRPAIGYPSLPDQSVIFIIEKLLGLDELGIILSANGAMEPHASVCGIMLAHPQARYFAVGDISDAQLADYAARRGLSTGDARKFLTKNIQ